MNKKTHTKKQCSSLSCQHSIKKQPLNHSTDMLSASILSTRQIVSTSSILNYTSISVLLFQYFPITILNFWCYRKWWGPTEKESKKEKQQQQKTPISNLGGTLNIGRLGWIPVIYWKSDACISGYMLTSSFPEIRRW